MEDENDKMKSTGERIKALLNEKKMTQRQLAELSGESKQESLYKYEVYCPVCGATWKRKTRCKLVRDSDLFYCKRCEVELKVRVIGGK